MFYRVKLPDFHLEADCIQALNACSSSVFYDLSILHAANVFSLPLDTMTTSLFITYVNAASYNRTHYVQRRHLSICSQILLSQELLQFTDLCFEELPVFLCPSPSPLCDSCFEALTLGGQSPRSTVHVQCITESFENDTVNRYLIHFQQIWKRQKKKMPLRYIFIKIYYRIIVYFPV